MGSVQCESADVDDGCADACGSPGGTSAMLSERRGGFIPAEDRPRLLALCWRLARLVAKHDGRPHYVDLAIVSRTAPCGHRPHVDNEYPVRLPDGACQWAPGRSGHRTWSVSVMLSEPVEYEGGELVFYRAPPGKPRPRASIKERGGSGIAFLGDRHHAHGVNPVTSGERFVLVLFLRGAPEGPPVPRLYRRQGNGLAFFLEPDMRTVSPGLCFAAWLSFARAAKGLS